MASASTLARVQLPCPCLPLCMPLPVASAAPPRHPRCPAANPAGTILTKPVPGQFSRGCEDVFVYPRMPFLGEILQMRVGTSGEGMFATWHLRSVEVAHIASGDQWVLPCHAWIDKKCGWVRTLTAARGQGVAAGAAP